MQQKEAMYEDAFVRARKRHADKRCAEATRAEGSASDKTTYCVLIKNLCERGLSVHVHKGEIANGCYFSDRPVPVVELYRSREDRIGDVRNELFTLAHEAGHWLSDSEGWPDGYVESRDRLHERKELYEESFYGGDVLVPERVTAEAGKLYAEEEAKAWRLGRSLLEEAGYLELAAFDAHVKAALDVVREIVSLHAQTGDVGLVPR